MTENKIRTGCKDVFHASLVKHASYAGQYELPTISGTKSIPNKVIPFSKILQTKDYDQWVHFYEDDFLFERIWNTPKKYLPILSKFNGVILPDFSLYKDMPLVMQLWNIYRSRAIGTWLESEGKAVIPNIRSGDYRTHAPSCEGIAHNSIIAFGTIGCTRDKDARKDLIAGMKYAIKTLTPIAIVIVGSVPTEISTLCKQNGIEIIAFDSPTTEAYKRSVA